MSLSPNSVSLADWPFSQMMSSWPSTSSQRLQFTPHVAIRQAELSCSCRDRALLGYRLQQGHQGVAQQRGLCRRGGCVVIFVTEGVVKTDAMHD